MKNILLIDSSPRGADSATRQLSKAIVEKLKASHPAARVHEHDLIKNPTPHLEVSHLAAFYAPPEKHSAADKEAIRHSEQEIREVMAADAIVIGVPMYNLALPSTLKSWIDHLCRAGQTFRYTASGPEGLVKGKKIFLAIATGGVYSEGPMKAYDFTEPYMRAVLGFMGMTDVTVFRAEGLAVPDLKDTAVEKAIKAVRASSI